MAKLVVEIELKGITKTAIEDNPEWFHEDDPSYVVLDSIYLTTYANDDSFYSFKLRTIED